MSSIFDRIRWALGDTSVAQREVQQTTRTLRRQANSFDKEVARIDFRANGLKQRLKGMTSEAWYAAYGTQYNALMRTRATLVQQTNNVHSLSATVQSAGVAIATQATVSDIVPVLRNLQYFSDPSEVQAAVGDIKGAKGALDANVRATEATLNESWDESESGEPEVDHARALIAEQTGVTLAPTPAPAASAAASSTSHVDDLERRLAALASP